MELWASPVVQSPMLLVACPCVVTAGLCQTPVVDPPLLGVRGGHVPGRCQEKNRFFVHVNLLLCFP